MTAALVVQTAWLGDVLLTTPLLAAAARRHAAVDMLVTPAAAPLVETHPAVRAVHVWDKRARDRGAAGLWRTVRRLRRIGYGTAYLAQGSWRSALAVRLAGIPERVGFADAPGRVLWTARVPRDGGRHEAARLAALADPDAPATLTLHRTPRDQADATRALERAGVRPPFVVLAPGTARATKRWPYYADLATALAGTMPVVWIGAAGDAPAGVPGTVDLSGLPLRVSGAVVARAAAAVTNDSFALHLCQAVGTPVVALYGPTAPAQGFGPRGPHDRTPGVDLPCRPCSAHGPARCPLGHHRCLRDLTADRVRQAVVEVLRASAPRAAG